MPTESGLRAVQQTADIFPVCPNHKGCNQKRQHEYRPIPGQKISVVIELAAPDTDPSETYRVVSHSSANSPQPTAAMRQSSSSRSVPLQRMPLPPI